MYNHYVALPLKFLSPLENLYLFWAGLAQNVLNIARLRSVCYPMKFNLVRQTVFLVRGWGLGMTHMDLAHLSIHLWPLKHDSNSQTWSHFCTKLHLHLFTMPKSSPHLKNSVQVSKLDRSNCAYELLFSLFLTLQLSCDCYVTIMWDTYLV